MISPYKHLSREGLLLLAFFIIAVSWRYWDGQQSKPEISIISEPPANAVLHFVAGGDEQLLARVLTLWLQQQDVQHGEYISFRQLDYSNILAWFEAIQQLDSSTQYPQLLATRVYSTVADDDRRRLMLEYVYRQFQQDAAKNWRWLAEATLTARHGLKDQQLALKYATALAESNDSSIPFWAKDIRLTILEDMGEYEQVQLLVGGMISEKAVTDENELHFYEILLDRLQKNNN